MSNRYNEFGQFEKALSNANESLRLNPKDVFAYQNAESAYEKLDRFDEAKAIADQSIAQHADSFGVHEVLYEIAFIRGDAAGMQHEIAWATGKQNGSLHALCSGGADYAMGRVHRGRETVARAIARAQQAGLKAVAADARAGMSVGEAALGYIQEARDGAAEALAVFPRPGYEDLGGSHAGVDGRYEPGSEAHRRLGERVSSGYAAQQCRASHSAGHHRVATQEPDPGHCSCWKLPSLMESPTFGSIYVRGEAYLQAHDGAEAAAEFQKILDHRGVSPLDAAYALARLGLGRALALEGQTAKARTAYQDFLASWKDADPDIPVLKQAKEEYEKLK